MVMTVLSNDYLDNVYMGNYKLQTSPQTSKF